MPKDIDEIKFMRKAFLPVLPLVYDDALSYIEFLGKVCDKCNEIIEAMGNIEADILGEAKAYTDEKVGNLEQSYTDFVSTINSKIIQIETENEDFETRVTNEINRLIAEINSFNSVIEATTNAINARTDLVVQENNEMLLREMQSYLANILVRNYITGEQTTIQDMFNFLCMYHLTNPITYTQLASRDCTYNALVAYNMTYTDLITNGATIIE